MKKFAGGKMPLTIILGFIYFIIAQLTSQPGQFDDGSNLMLKIFIPTGAVSGTFSVIWFYLVKHLLRQNQKQFEFALNQNQGQFDRALKQINDQHRENLDQNQKTTDRMLAVIKQGNENEVVLIGILKEIKTTLKFHMQNHEDE